MGGLLPATTQAWEALVADWTPAQLGDVGAGVYNTALRYVAERRKLGELSRASARIYWYSLTMFADHVGEQFPVNRLQRRHVERWLLSMDVAPGTLRQRLSALRVFCRWCVEHDLLKRDPTVGVKGPRRRRLVPRAIEGTTIGKVMLEADERGQVAMLLMAQEGCRLAEVARMTIDNIDLDRRTVLVLGKGGHERILPLSDETAKAIDVYLTMYPAGPGMPLIRSYRHPSRGITPTRLGHLVTTWMRQAGVKQRAWDGKSAHAFRHSCACHMLDNGADPRDVQEYLGHQHLSTTSVYTVRAAAVGRLRTASEGRSYLNGS